jgi:hypothetical protein
MTDEAAAIFLELLAEMARHRRVALESAEQARTNQKRALANYDTFAADEAAEDIAYSQGEVAACDAVIAAIVRLTGITPQTEG